MHEIYLLTIRRKTTYSRNLASTTVLFLEADLLSNLIALLT